MEDPDLVVVDMSDPRTWELGKSVLRTFRVGVYWTNQQRMAFLLYLVAALADEPPPGPATGPKGTNKRWVKGDADT